MNLVLLTFWTLRASVTRRRSKHWAPQPSPHIPSASASAAGSGGGVKHTLELRPGIKSKCKRSHFPKKPRAVTSCRCFSHMTAYWPMWLSRLTTLLLTWCGRGYTCVIVQRNCLLWRELITAKEKAGLWYWLRSWFPWPGWHTSACWECRRTSWTKDWRWQSSPYYSCRPRSLWVSVSACCLCTV